MKGWKEKLLSQAGREELIKSIVQAMPTYAMSCFILLETICDEIATMVQKFWWGGKKDTAICLKK